MEAFYGMNNYKVNNEQNIENFRYKTLKNND